MKLPNYDNWKLSNDLVYEKPLIKCDWCKEDLFEGDEVVEFDCLYFCSDECYVEGIINKIKPNTITLKKGDIR